MARSGSRRQQPDRDRGKDRSSAPPTPPYVRVRIRRFVWLCYRPSTNPATRHAPPPSTESLAKPPRGWSTRPFAPPFFRTLRSPERPCVSLTLPLHQVG